MVQKEVKKDREYYLYVKINENRHARFRHTPRSDKNVSVRE